MKPDPETRVINAVMRALEGLGPHERWRVIRYVHARVCDDYHEAVEAREARERRLPHERENGPQSRPNALGAPQTPEGRPEVG